MGLTAFIPTAAPQILPFIGSPGAGTVGHALVWSQSPQGFTLAPLAVGPDQFSGVLPVAKGGTGTATGSITGTGTLTLASGGSNQNLTLAPSGTGKVIAPNIQLGAVSDYQITLGGSGLYNGILLNSADYGNLPFPGTYNNTVLLNSRGFSFIADGTTIPSSSPYNVSLGIAIGANRDQNLLVVKQGENYYYGAAFDCRVGISTPTPSTALHVARVSESTSTTTGSVRIDGGLGVEGAIHGGKTLTLASDSISTPAVVAGEIRGLKIGTAPSQKIGFFNATPVVQQAAVANATDAASTQASLNELLARLRSLGLIAT